MQPNKRAFVIFILSNILWGIAIFSPFLPMKTHEKIIVGTICATVGEIAFWVFVSIVGKEAAEKYKKYLTIKYWKDKIK